MTEVVTKEERLHRVPVDLGKLLRKSAEVKKFWDDLTPLARNEWICWVTMVKKAETRQAHLERLVQDLIRGKKRPCCWPGCPHRRPQTAKWFGKK